MGDRGTPAQAARPGAHGRSADTHGSRGAAAAQAAKEAEEIGDARRRRDVETKRPPRVTTELTLSVAGRGEVSALHRPADNPVALLVLAHGAGAGMRHPFLEALAEAYSARGVSTLRYMFPYMETGRGRPDPPQVLHAAVRTAVTAAGLLANGL